MPFTFAHPAAVLPFGLFPPRWISMTGLIVGSLMPDFEYFLRLKVQSDYSHTIAGLFLFDLPVGLVNYFIFQKIVRKSLFDNLPRVIRSRVLQVPRTSLTPNSKNSILVIIASILIGAEHI